MSNEDENVIYTYTAKQAVEDGTLIEYNPATALEAGYALPVLLTRKAYEDVVEWTRPGDVWQDEDGRFWDVLTMARGATKAALSAPGHPYGFKVARIANKTPGGSFSKSELPSVVQLVARVEGYDGNVNPCVIISLPGED